MDETLVEVFLVVGVLAVVAVVASTNSQTQAPPTVLTPQQSAYGQASAGSSGFEQNTYEGLNPGGLGY